MLQEENLDLNKEELKIAPKESVIRLAKYLQLNIDGMSHNQVVRLIRWKLTRRKKFNNFI